jgi:hypothetical protein
LKSGSLIASPPDRFAGRRRLDGEGMEAGLEFGSQGSIDGAVSIDPAHAGKGGCDNSYPEMRFALAVELGDMAVLDMMMARMQVAFIDDRQPIGRKSLGQFRFDRRLYGHRRYPSPHRRYRQKESAAASIKP